MGRKTGMIPKAPVARLLLKAGAKRVSIGAVNAFTKVIEEVTSKIALRAKDNAEHSGRKTVQEKDIELAMKP